jgi:hypothetical protein
VKAAFATRHRTGPPAPRSEAVIPATTFVKTDRRHAAQPGWTSCVGGSSAPVPPGHRGNPGCGRPARRPHPGALPGTPVGGAGGSWLRVPCVYGSTGDPARPHEVAGHTDTRRIRVDASTARQRPAHRYAGPGFPRRARHAGAIAGPPAYAVGQRGGQRATARGGGLSRVNVVSVDGVKLRKALVDSPARLQLIAMGCQWSVLVLWSWSSSRSSRVRVTWARQVRCGPGRPAASPVWPSARYTAIWRPGSPPPAGRPRRRWPPRRRSRTMLCAVGHAPLALLRLVPMGHPPGPCSTGLRSRVWPRRKP